VSALPAGARGPARLFLIDDHAMFRAALRTMLEWPGRTTVVGDSADARSAVAAIGKLRPDVVLLDIAMPGLSGIDAIPRIRRAHAGARILMLTHHEGSTFVEEALRAGADGYLSKDSGPDELRIAIESVTRGYPFISPKLSAPLVAGTRGPRGARPSASRLSHLTAREREVFQLLALGRSNKEVARELEMSLGTAKKHRENLQRKLDSHSAAELARIAIEEGLLRC